jgi:hypothetical protein
MATQIKIVFKNKQGVLTARVPSNDRSADRNVIGNILKQPPTSGTSLEFEDVYGSHYAVDMNSVLYVKLEEV